MVSGTTVVRCTLRDQNGEVIGRDALVVNGTGIESVTIPLRVGRKSFEVVVEFDEVGDRS